jgi:hypothetical protein
MTMRVVILTGSELRHTFFRKALALDPGVEVLLSVCEGQEKSLLRLLDPAREGVELQREHILAREASEQDFFYPFVRMTPDSSHPRFIGKGRVNDREIVESIVDLQPDLLLAYGCSIIKAPLLEAFPRRFLNVHLGLSPYYRGSGTNFWPLVNGEPEFVGATFMYIDAGVDTGEIIHQIRARIHPGDTPHQIGNRLIGDMTIVYRDVVGKYGELVPMAQPPVPQNERYYRTKDFSPESVEQLYANFRSGLVEAFLRERDERLHHSPLVEQPAIAPVREG